MEFLTIDQARAQLPRLVERAAQGESFVIIEEGRPLAKVTAAQEPRAAYEVHRLGFLSGRMIVPDDFDRMGSTAIEQLFGA